MFGLSLGSQLIQDSAEKTWNCISQIANLLWYKLNYTREPIMPRQRRRSRSRSRSHSHDKSRDVKRRKIECESPNGPNHKRSVSPEDHNPDHLTPEENMECITIDLSDENSKDVESSENDKAESTNNEGASIESEDVQITDCTTPKSNKEQKDDNTSCTNTTPRPTKRKLESEKSCQQKEDEQQSPSEKQSRNNVNVVSSEDISEETESSEKDSNESSNISEKSTPSSRDLRKRVTAKNSENGDVQMAETTPKSKNSDKPKDEITPVRNMTPKQMQKKLESEKKRQQKEKEREAREKQKQDEKEKKEAEKLKKKEEKLKEIEQKQKEKEEKEEQKKREKEEREEQKKKEREEKEEQKNKEKEQKRIEREKKEEQKRKEKEEEKLRKQQEIDEKNKEKQKEEEKKQKAAAAFVSFFVPKKVITEEKKPEKISSAFMPFQVKSDMKLPPFRREPLTTDEKNKLVQLLESNSAQYSYLTDLKTAKIRSCSKTWPCQEMDEDVTVIEDEEILGETICEEKPKTERMRAKYLKFHENQRPAYYGTWRKKSTKITGRRPFGLETIFDYEVDSDDDWEEEEQGENLEVMSDDDKENEPENEDYEVDNEFFVPHGHLSDDEVDDEETAKLSPESQKQKLKLLKDAFEEDMKSKTQKIKPRSIGCIWYNEKGTNVDEAIDRYLNPLAVITNGQIEIKKRGLDTNNQKKKKPAPSQEIPEKLMPILLKLVHGNTIKRKFLVDEFLNFVRKDNADLELSKTTVSKSIANIAQWEKNAEIKTKFCWMVNVEIAEKYNFELTIPNDWESVKNTRKAL